MASMPQLDLYGIPEVRKGKKIPLLSLYNLFVLFELEISLSNLFFFYLRPPPSPFLFVIGFYKQNLIRNDDE